MNFQPNNFYTSRIKYIYCILICLAFVLISKAQNKTAPHDLKYEELYNRLSESKSANLKDVLTDFMQASVHNITGEDKSISFNATLFSLKVKADSSLLYDYNYVEQKFSRNFQIDIALNLDEDYRFDGFKYGFTYAIINKRDTTVADLSDKVVGEQFRNLSSNLILARNNYKNKYGNNDEYKKIEEITDKILERGYYVPQDSLPREFIDLLPKNYKALSDEFSENFNNEIERIKRQPFLTVNFSSHFQKDSKFLDSYNVGLVYLHGIKSKHASMEIDFRSKLTARDSILSQNIIKRNEFSSQLGLNIGLIEKNKTSILEFKPSFEYRNVFKGAIEDEKESQFFANADLRVRITKNLWIPLVVKYDLESNNLFGFLNVNFNFDAMKG